MAGDRETGARHTTSNAPKDGITSEADQPATAPFVPMCENAGAAKILLVILQGN